MLSRMCRFLQYCSIRQGKAGSRCPSWVKRIGRRGGKEQGMKIKTLIPVTWLQLPYECNERHANTLYT